jgi:lantibiotic modifying enzyme
LAASGPLAEPSSQTLIATAARIGDRICELAIEDGDRCTWLVPELANPKRLVTSVAGMELYGGLPGIALFLGHLGATTGEGRDGDAEARRSAPGFRDQAAQQKVTERDLRPDVI